MDIVWLRDFEALSNHRSFSRAADERNVSQPAFSRRIRALEDEVGVSLINRQTLPLSLTPAGEVFLSQAQIMLRTYADTIERCHNIAASGDKALRFATTQSLYITQFRQYIEPLAEQNGLDIDLSSTSWSAEQFVSALQQQYCDVILTYWHEAMTFLAPLDSAQTDYLLVSREQLVPVARCLGQGEPEFQLIPETKKPIPLLNYSSGSALRPVIESVLSHQGALLNTLVLNQNALATSVKALILEGFGLGWLPRSLCQDDIDQGRLAIAGPPRYFCELDVRLYREQQNPKAMLKKFWQRMKEQSQES